MWFFTSRDPGLKERQLEVAEAAAARAAREREEMTRRLEITMGKLLTDRGTTDADN